MEIFLFILCIVIGIIGILLVIVGVFEQDEEIIMYGAMCFMIITLIATIAKYIFS